MRAPRRIDASCILPRIPGADRLAGEPCGAGRRRRRPAFRHRPQSSRLASASDLPLSGTSPLAAAGPAGAFRSRLTSASERGLDVATAAAALDLETGIRSSDLFASASVRTVVGSRRAGSDATAAPAISDTPSSVSALEAGVVFISILTLLSRWLGAPGKRHDKPTREINVGSRQRRNTCSDITSMSSPAATSAGLLLLATRCA